MTVLLISVLLFGLVSCGVFGENGDVVDSGNNDMQLGKGASAAVSDWDRYDALIEEIRTTTDFAVRADTMHDAEDILMETLSVIPIYYYNDVYMMKSNVDGLYCTVTGMKYFRYTIRSE